MTMNKNRSYQKREARSQIYQKTTHREYQKLCEKPKTEKNHGVARKSTIIERLQGNKKELTPLFTMAQDFHHPHPNYDASPFIKKIRVTSCDISKLPLTRDLSFLYREVFRLYNIQCVSMRFRDVPTFCRSECSSRDSE